MSFSIGILGEHNPTVSTWISKTKQNKAVYSQVKEQTTGI